MIIKNIVIKHENKNLIIEISDSNFNKNKFEKDISKIFDTVLEEVVQDKNFERLVK